jgi:hypothetical protein
MKRKSSESNSAQKRSKKIVIPDNFVKTPFGDRASSKKTSELRSILKTDIEYYRRTNVAKWKKSALGDLMSVLTTAHLLKVDDAIMMSVIDDYGNWALHKPEFYEALDPSYVFINWGNVAPAPMNQWNVNNDVQGANSPVPLADFPNCCVLPNRDLSLIFIGIINSQYQGVKALRWDSPQPITCHER